MQNFLKENKQRLITMVIAFLLLIGSATVYALFFNNESAKVNDVSKEIYVKDDFNPKPISQINSVQNPLTYDFFSGTLGINEKYVEINGDKQYVFMTKQGSSKMYFAYKQGNEGDDVIERYLPHFSSEPIYYYFKSEPERAKFISGVENDKEIKKVEEGDYIFYVVREGKSMIPPQNRKEDFHGIDVAWLNSHSPVGKEDKLRFAGHGYPTNIIRKVSDLKTIKQEFKIDFNDSFWDRANYGARYKCWKKDKSGFIVLSPAHISIVAGLEPTYTFEVDKNVLPLDETDLSNLLVKSGYQSIDEVLNSKDYADESDVKKAENFIPIN